jgi:hypothetical protein
LIAGLVSPAQNTSNPALTAPLREIESQIAYRAEWLANRAAAERPAWYDAVLQAAHQTSEPGHAHLVGEVAAYRERYDIRLAAVLGASPSLGTTQHMQYSRLLELICHQAVATSQQSNEAQRNPAAPDPDASLPAGPAQDQTLRP